MWCALNVDEAGFTYHGWHYGALDRRTMTAHPEMHFEFTDKNDAVMFKMIFC
jgi:hypothetical protein